MDEPAADYEVRTQIQLCACDDCNRIAPKPVNGTNRRGSPPCSALAWVEDNPTAAIRAAAFRAGLRGKVLELRRDRWMKPNT